MGKVQETTIHVYKVNKKAETNACSQMFLFLGLMARIHGFISQAES